MLFLAINWALVGRIVLIVLLIIAVVLGILYFLARRMQPKYEQQQALMKQLAQTVTILVIDKKKLGLNESGLPNSVKEAVPSYMKWRKLPIVKARLQGRVMSLIADEKVFKDIPTKKEIKVSISGIYITKIIKK